MLALTLFLAAALGVLWVVGREDARAPASGPAPGHPASDTADAASPGPAPAVGGEAGPTRSLPETAGATEDAAPGEPTLVAGQAAADPERFTGTGRLRGHVEARGGSFPRTWTLLLEPSRFLEGRDHAVQRRIEFTAGEQEFVVSDLPLAGYDLRVFAPGWNSYTFPVLLDRDRPEVFLNLEIHPAGFVEGSVVQADALPAEGLAVSLEALATGERREARTDVAGRFRFEAVSDGDYRLVVGPPANPLVEPTSLRFQAPSMFLPPVELPPLASVTFVVNNPAGFPVEGASVRGAGSQGGLIEATTGPEGRCLARHLPPGRYRVRVSHGSFRSRRVNFDLDEDEDEEVVVVLDP